MTDRKLIRGLSTALLFTVASQIFYITVVSGSENEALRPITWMVELISFSLTTIFAMALTVRRPFQALGWAVIAFAGTLNVIQVAMGLSMFGPALEAGETVPQLFAAILAGAFFFYFLAKLLLGGAAVIFGLGAFGASSGWRKALGGVAALAGTAAVAAQLLAMVDAESWRFPAGATGTAVTALLAMLLLADASLPDRSRT